MSMREMFVESDKSQMIYRPNSSQTTNFIDERD